MFILAIALVLSLSVCVTYSGGEIALADDGSNVEVVVGGSNIFVKVAIVH